MQTISTENGVIATLKTVNGQQILSIENLNDIKLELTEELKEQVYQQRTLEGLANDFKEEIKAHHSFEADYFSENDYLDMAKSFIISANPDFSPIDIRNEIIQVFIDEAITFGKM